MGVQTGHHARNGLGDQLLFIDRLDIIGFDHAEDGGELLQLVHGQRGKRAPRHGLKLHGGEGTRHGTDRQPTHNFELAAHAFRHENPPLMGATQAPNRTNIHPGRASRQALP